jgi:crotonobetainyl-CoA:carnitine CoA-transferase CaiB-like acyl-CoA transferase
VSFGTNSPSLWTCWSLPPNPNLNRPQPVGLQTKTVRQLALIAKRLLERPREHWLELLAESDVPSAPVLTTQEYMDLPQVRHSELVQTAEDQRLGETSQMGMAIDFSETPGRTRMPVPVLGQHTEEILASLEDSGSSSSGSGKSPNQARLPNHPLEGMKVLDLSSFIAAPLGSMILSDLGADVIKVEPLSGEGARPLPFLIMGGNRGKRNLALDLKSPAVFRLHATWWSITCGEESQSDWASIMNRRESFGLT